MSDTMSQSAQIAEIEKQIAELEKTVESLATQDELERLRHQLDGLRQQLAGQSNEAWDRVLLARHPQRPYAQDWIKLLFTEFAELHGDRRFGDDKAMICGFARFNRRPVLVVGQQKGRGTKQKLQCNFGMTNPEGYRKALRLMQLAAKFRVPIISLVDTPGAYPGIGAEERGQAEAIAYNLKEIPKLLVPIVVVIIGEGGSGGALAIAVGDRILMLENAVYSVISPENCSTILWRDWDHKQEAARAMRMTAKDLLEFQIIDEVVPEPPGGAHASYEEAAELLRSALDRALTSLSAPPAAELLRRRQEKLRRLATFVSES
jgi:acetyl-CoA carboxylase carboxyl transferase subunit alpha